MLLPALLLLFGEAGCIFAEMLSASGRPWLALVVGLLPWPLLVLGYYLGYKSGGIWQTTVASVVAIVVVEPVIVMLMFDEKPKTFVVIGMVLAAMGLVVSSLK